MLVSYTVNYHIYDHDTTILQIFDGPTLSVYLKYTTAFWFAKHSLMYVKSLLANRNCALSLTNSGELIQQTMSCFACKAISGGSGQ